ncbi:MAG: DNA polymerase III subunit delta [Spirochaetia bacterium]
MATKKPATSSGVMLLLGPEIGEKREYLRKMAETIQGKGGEVYRFYAFDCDILEVVRTLRTGSLFGSQRLVIIQAADAIKSADDISALVEYCKAPATDARLVLESDEIRINKRLMTAVGQTGTKIFWEMFDNQKPGWVTSYLRRKGRRISGDTVEYLLELVAANTQELARVCDALVLVTEDQQEITVDHIDSFIYHSREENVFTLFDRIGERDLEAALESLHAIMLSGGSQAVGILAGLVWQFERLLKLRRMLDDRHSTQEAFNALKVRGKRAQRNLQKAAEAYPTDALGRILTRLVDVDAELRSVHAAWHGKLLELFLYDVIAAEGRHPESMRAEAGSYL